MPRCIAATDTQLDHREGCEGFIPLSLSLLFPSISFMIDVHHYFTPASQNKGVPQFSLI